MGHSQYAAGGGGGAVRRNAGGRASGGAAGLHRPVRFDGAGIQYRLAFADNPAVHDLMQQTLCMYAAARCCTDAVHLFVKNIQLFFHANHRPALIIPQNNTARKVFSTVSHDTVPSSGAAVKNMRWSAASASTVHTTAVHAVPSVAAPALPSL